MKKVNILSTYPNVNNKINYKKLTTVKFIEQSIGQKNI
jgi:hypothetical protein